MKARTLNRIGDYWYVPLVVLIVGSTLVVLIVGSIALVVGAKIDAATPPGQHAMQCTRVSSGIYRCENAEAICYMRSDAIHCWLKSGPCRDEAL